ncbi:uncharacterized protein NEMAJ01_0505 [Nematocida major]|uniref:uncharacterized protein n=1 Tax=Nematocida major TaxID=1912982 RepID=UPI0020085511|nr:uncharacterized protein NEMAJ01_0505 [Nematocida major]KAH9385609.1 hypothetical protein NEMAJ01_0505 [Nematocida major]
MRGPRFSYSEDFRAVWDKENINPKSREFSRRTFLPGDVPECASEEPAKPTQQKQKPKSIPLKQTWLDDILGCK